MTSRATTPRRAGRWLVLLLLGLLGLLGAVARGAAAQDAPSPPPIAPPPSPLRPQNGALREKWQEAQKRHLAGEIEPARALMKEILDADPKNVELALSLARWLARERSDFAGAEPFARRAYELDARSAEAIQLLGSSLVFTGRNGEAESVYRAAVALFPASAAMHHGLAMSCGQQKKYLEAKAEYAAATQLDPDDGLIHFSAGENLANLREYDAAERELRLAVKLKGHADAAWKLGEVLAKEGKEVEAERTLGAALDQGPPASRYNAHLQLGIFCFERKRNDEAASLMHKATKIKPDGRDAWMWLARAQRALGKDEASARSLRKYQELREKEDRLEEERLLDLIRAQLGE